jgi:hypothetical protein
VATKLALTPRSAESAPATDADHVAAVPQIAKRYKTLRTWRLGGRPKGNPSVTWTATNEAFEREPGLQDIHLMKTPVPGGATYVFGDTTLTIVNGYGVPPKSWKLKTNAKMNK